MKVKSHMGMPLNAAADAQADVGAEADPTMSRTTETVTMPIMFRAQTHLPTLHLSQFTLDCMARRGTEPLPPYPQPAPLQWTGIRGEAKKLVSQLVHQRVDDMVLA